MPNEEAINTPETVEAQRGKGWQFGVIAMLGFIVLIAIVGSSPSGVAFVFFAPIAGVSLAAYLITSGWREGVVRYYHALAGLLILVGLCLTAFFAASNSNDSGMIAFILMLIIAPAAFICGILMLFVLAGPRKLNSALVGILFPVVLYSSVIHGMAIAPKEPTLAEEYVAVTRNLLDTLPDAPNTFQLTSRHQECKDFLQQTVEEYSGQAVIEISVLHDPRHDTYHSIPSQADMLVSFPDGRQVELGFYDGFTWTTCEIITR